MNHRALLQRAIGFGPQEICAMVNEPVVSRHAEEAAFLWTLRNRAIREPHYSLQDLAALDERVEAHLDGLRTAAAVGWKWCKENLASQGPGEVFAAAVLAFSAGDRDKMSEALNAGCASPTTTAGLVSALGWIKSPTISAWLVRLHEARSARHRRVGIAASAIRRDDPGSVLTLAINDSDPELRARALRASGELKRHDLLNHLHDHLSDEDDACRFWAAWSLTLNGDRSALGVLTGWLERDDAFKHRAFDVSLRALNVEQSRQWIRNLAKEPKQERFAVMGTGIVGDPASIPWLIRRMESPESARVAGEAFSMITGADLAFHDLDQETPSLQDGEHASIEELLDLNYEGNLGWPSPTRVAEWWERNSRTFTSGVRYLAGKPITPQSILEVLLSGKQRQRAAAALELALFYPDQTLFETRARGSWQQRDLAAWTL